MLRNAPHALDVVNITAFDAGAIVSQVLLVGNVYLANAKIQGHLYELFPAEAAGAVPSEGVAHHLGCLFFSIGGVDAIADIGQQFQAGDGPPAALLDQFGVVHITVQHHIPHIIGNARLYVCVKEIIGSNRGRIFGFLRLRLDGTDEDKRTASQGERPDKPHCPDGRVQSYPDMRVSPLKSANRRVIDSLSVTPIKDLNRRVVFSAEAISEE